MISIMVSLRGEELWVAGCVQAALPGVTVGQHDDNSTRNVHDLDLSLPGGRTFGAMEVTAAADADLIECWKLLNGHGNRWIAPGIAGGWSVTVLPTARVKQLIKELPSLLQALEQSGLDSLPRRHKGWGHLAAAAEELGVVRARQGGTSFPGSIYVTPQIPQERAGGWVASTGDALSEWISDWIIDPSRGDNLTKLRRSAAAEHHLFVIAPGIESTAPFSVTDLLMRADAPLPTVAPVMPDGVTHVWIMGAWVNGRGFRWSPDCGWETFANNAVLDRAALLGCTC